MSDTTHQVTISPADAQRGQAAARQLGFDFHVLAKGIVPHLIPLVIIVLEKMAEQQNSPSGQQR